MNVAVIVSSIIAILVIIGFTVFILIVALRDRDNTSTSNNNNNIDNTESNNVVSRINWIEVNRGFPATSFPPCFESSGEVKKIYSILAGYNLQKKYIMLLDIYSMLLCEDLQIRAKACSDTFVNDRLADLHTYGGDANDQRAMEIVKSVTNVRNNKMGKMLIMSTDLIEREMKSIQGDNAISKADKEQIFGYNSLFYRRVYDFMNRRCP
jgi:hypothetical protein